MEDIRQNPLVDALPPEELDAQETTVTHGDAQVVPAPIAEGADEQPIERRSRRQKAGATDSAAQQPVDLTQFEEFRKYQAERDRQLESERQRALQLERAMEERAQKEAYDRLQYLESVMDDETLELDTRRQARQEFAWLSNQAYAMQLQRWESYKRQAITEAGLDPTDQRFARQYSPGQAGLAEFQADLHAAENARLKSELEKAKKSAATPETLAALVRAEVAKLARTQGFDAVDLGEPTAAGDDDDAYERDAMAFNNGRMSGQEFLRKWGKR